MPKATVTRPPKDDLERLYVTEGLSCLAISRRYGVAFAKAKEWLLETNLWDYDKAKANKFKGKSPALKTDENSAQADLVLEGEFEVVGQSEAQPSVLTNSGLALVENDVDELAAFDLLNRTQQAIALLEVQCLTQHVKRTLEDKSKTVSIEPPTYARHLEDKMVRTAISDLMTEEVNYRGRLRFQEVLLLDLEERKLKPDQYRLFAEMFGMVGGNQVFNNFGTVITGDQRLVGRFKGAK